VATRVAARWHGRAGLTDGQGVARLAGTPRGSDGGSTRQCGGDGVPTGDGQRWWGGEKWSGAMAFRGSGGAPVVGEGVDEVL
jgi:hypothetical protein